MLTADKRARQALDSALTEVDVSAKFFTLARIDTGGRPAHITGARYACDEARRHLATLRNRDSVYAPVEARIEELLTQMREWERKQAAAAQSTARVSNPLESPRRREKRSTAQGR